MMRQSRVTLRDALELVHRHGLDSENPELVGRVTSHLVDDKDEQRRRILTELLVQLLSEHGVLDVRTRKREPSKRPEPPRSTEISETD